MALNTSTLGHTPGSPVGGLLDGGSENTRDMAHSLRASRSRYLSFASVDLSDVVEAPRELEHMTRVSNLNFYGAKLREQHLSTVWSEFVASFETLTALSLSYNEVSCLPTRFGERLPITLRELQLETMPLDPARPFEDDGRWFSRLTSLTSLSLSSCTSLATNNPRSIVPTTLSMFAHLQQLNLSRCGLCDHHLEPLNSMAIAMTNGTDTDTDTDTNTDTESHGSASTVTLRETPPQCNGHQHTSSHTCSYDDAVAAVISSLATLKSIQLHENQLTYIPEWIARLPDLQYLSIAANKLTEVTASLYRCSTLRDLDLSDNFLTHLGGKRVRRARARAASAVDERDSDDSTNTSTSSFSSEQLDTAPSSRASSSSSVGVVDDSASTTATLANAAAVDATTSSPKRCSMLPSSSTVATEERKQHHEHEHNHEHNHEEEGEEEVFEDDPEADQWEWQSMRRLTASNNRIEFVSSIGIRRAVSLIRLDLSNNALRHLPNLSTLTSLRNLRIESNHIAELPLTLAQVTSLQELSLKENPLIEVPREITRMAFHHKVFLQTSIADQIIPGLFLGPQEAASSLEYLGQLRIHSVVRVLRDAQVPIFADNLKYLIIPIPDSCTFDISQFFADAVCFIEHELEHQRNVLVCTRSSEQTNERRERALR